MKKINYIICLCFLILTNCIFCSGCTKEEFTHKTIYFNPEYNGGKFQFEITVTEVSNNYSSNIWSRGLDATIEIKTKTTEDVVTGWLLELYDFKFYLTKPCTIYETYMYLENPQEKITQLVLEPQTTIKLHLRIDYDSSIFNKNNELNNYVIKLWNIRI